jgi:hydroxymethylglutaryl-CoA reductase
MLGNPTSLDLMKIICSVGLAQNFAAVKSLVSSGIQKGHMKMHLINLLIKNSANKTQIENSKEYFKDKEINNQSVIEFLNLKNLK